MSAGDRLIFRGAAVSYVIRVLGVGAGLGLHVALARWLGESEYGGYAFVTSVLPIVGILATLGLPMAAVRFWPEYGAASDSARLAGFHAFSTRAVIGAGAAGLLLTLLAVPFLGAEGNVIRRSTLVASPLIPILALIRYRQEALRGLKRIAASQAFEQVILPVGILLAAGAWILGGRSLDAPTVILIHLGVAAAGIVGLGRLLRRDIPDAVPAWTRQDMRVWLAVSLPLMGSTFVSGFMPRAAPLFLGIQGSPASVAHYVAAFKLATVLKFSLSAVNAILAPTVAERYGRGDRAALQAEVSRTVRRAFAITVPIALAIVAFRGPLLSLFGEGFVVGSRVLLILVGAELVNVAAGPVGPLLTMTGHQRFYLGVLSAVAAVTAGAMPLAIAAGGIEGAAWVALLAAVLWNGILAAGTIRRTGIAPYLTVGRRSA
ncbi:MAG: oligosaccharide flippase family protein [Gemmatimonadota bacterium]